MNHDGLEKWMLTYYEDYSGQVGTVTQSLGNQQFTVEWSDNIRTTHHLNHLKFENEGISE